MLLISQQREQALRQEEEEEREMWHRYGAMGWGIGIPLPLVNVYVVEHDKSAVSAMLWEICDAFA